MFDFLLGPLPDGNVINFAGTGAPGFKDGTCGQAQFEWPAGIAFDIDGTVLVADRDNNRVRQIRGTSVFSVRVSVCEGLRVVQLDCKGCIDSEKEN